MSTLLVRADDGTEIEISQNQEDGSADWDCFTCFPSDGMTYSNLPDAINSAQVHAQVKHRKE